MQLRGRDAPIALCRIHHDGRRVIASVLLLSSWLVVAILSSTSRSHRDRANEPRAPLLSLGAVVERNVTLARR